MPDDEEATYKIIRFHFDENHPDHRKVITTGLSYDSAREYCRNDLSHGDGWFDGYEEES